VNLSDDHEERPVFVDLTIVEFAAHIAYLDPMTGTGYLVLPHADRDVDAMPDPLVDAACSERVSAFGNTAPLSLHAADRRRVVTRLAESGWSLLRDENGEVEPAGRTNDGRQALCIYGPSSVEQPTLDDFDCAIIALDIAAGLDPGSVCDQDLAFWRD